MKKKQEGAKGRKQPNSKEKKISWGITHIQRNRGGGGKGLVGGKGGVQVQVNHLGNSGFSLHEGG